jgi:hypothetical protein
LGHAQHARALKLFECGVSRIIRHPAIRNDSSAICEVGRAMPFRNGLISMIVMDYVLRSLAKPVYVHLIMTQSANGQQLAPRDDRRFTAERVLRTRPKTYRAIVQLLADPDAKIERIAKLHRVSTHTVRAIRGREAVSIAERKQRLMSIFGNVAELSAERMEELAGQASLRDAGITAGIATDKLLALSGDPALTIQCDFTLRNRQYYEYHAGLDGMLAQVGGKPMADADHFAKWNAIHNAIQARSLPAPAAGSTKAPPPVLADASRREETAAQKQS